MKNGIISKKTVLIVFMSLFTNLLAQKHSKWSSVEYLHNSNTPYSVFTIDMNITNKNVKGVFCYISGYGKRIDCNNIFVSTIMNNKTYLDFNSSFGGKNGKAVITFLSDKRIEWKILKNPDGEFYAPRKAVLINETTNRQKQKFYKPSFSCKNVKKESIEYKICTDKELANLDKKLSKVYMDVKKTLPEVLKKTYQEGQISWIKKRNQCKDNECIKRSYEHRISYLIKLLPKNKAFSPYLVFELIKLFQCDEKRCKDPLQKEIYNALITKKDIKILDPVAWGNSLDDDVFKKYLGGMNQYMKNKISYVGLKQDKRYYSRDTFDYSTNALKESMKKGEALKAMCNFKLYEIDYNYYDHRSNPISLIKKDKAYLMFADATMSQEEILKKEKADYVGSLITIINPKTLKQDNTFQFQRAGTTNCYRPTKTIAGFFLYKGIYYHFESNYFSGDDSYGLFRVVFIQKGTYKFHDVMNLRLMKEK